MFIKKFVAYLFGGFSFLTGFIFYYIKPNETWNINKAPAILFIVAIATIIIALIIDIVRLYSECKKLKSEKQEFYRVTKVIQNYNNSVIVLTDELENSKAGTAISIYIEEDEHESFAFHGSILEKQSNGLVKILIPILTNNGIETLMNKDNWSKLRIKTTFPYYLMKNLLTENLFLTQHLQNITQVDNKEKIEDNMPVET